MLCFNCFKGNCVGAPDKNKNCRRKNIRELSSNGVFFQVVIPVFFSISTPCIRKIPAIPGSFAFCREDYRAREKEDADFLTSIRK